MRKNLLDFYIKEQIYQLSYEEALIHDKESFFTYFQNLLIEKEILLSIFFRRTKCFYTALKLEHLLFFFQLIQFGDAFFFTDDHITQRFYSKNPGTFSYIIKNELSKSLYTCIFAFLINKIMIKECTYVKTTYYKLTTGDNNRRLSAFKKALLVYTITQILFILFFGYYLILFSNFFPNTCKSLLKTTLVSIIMYYLIISSLCFIFGIFRYIGLKFKDKLCFSLSQFCLSLI